MISQLSTSRDVIWPLFMNLLVDHFSLFIITCIYLSKTFLATATCLDFLAIATTLCYHLYVLDFSKALLYWEQYTHFLPFSLFPLRLLILPRIRTFKKPIQNFRQIFHVFKINERHWRTALASLIGFRCLCTALASLTWSGF